MFKPVLVVVAEVHESTNVPTSLNEIQSLSELQGFEAPPPIKRSSFRTPKIGRASFYPSLEEERI